MLKKGTKQKTMFGLKRFLTNQENRRLVRENQVRSSYLTKDAKVSLIYLATLGGWLWQGLAAFGGVPNGTWLSKPQISFHSSTNTLNQVMRDIQRQQYKVVFLDFRGVSDELQQRVSQEARAQRLIPVVWIQSPQYRSLTVSQLIYEARHGDAIQVDDHFFSHYSKRQFQSLSYQYKKPIFCSIQPFQARVIGQGQCNQLDVQCYVPQKFQSCISLADRLKAVVSLSDKNTFKYRGKLGRRRFNVFLWPYSERVLGTNFLDQFGAGNPSGNSFSLFQLPKLRAKNIQEDDIYITSDASQKIGF